MQRKNVFIGLFLALLLAAYYSTCSGGITPTSFRARQAIHRVSPTLKKDLDKVHLQYGAPVFMRIFKQEKELEVWLKDRDNYRLFRTYPICTYGTSASLGPKQKEGDGQAPEGFYFVKPSSLNPNSSYHLSFNLGYPNRYDRSHARTGSALMVHGNCVSIGCYAMTDEGIEEIYTLADAALKNGQPFFRVHIFPFKMSSENMEKNKDPKWDSFWVNLKEGYDFFLNNGNTPPNVEVANNQYVFKP